MNLENKGHSIYESDSREEINRFHAINRGSSAHKRRSNSDGDTVAFYNSLAEINKFPVNGSEQDINLTPVSEYKGVHI